MRARFFFLTLLTLLITLHTRAELFKELRYGALSFTISGGLDQAWSDASPNSTTVYGSLSNNAARSRYEFRLWNYQTGSRDLTSGLDATAGTDIYADFFIYPNGHALQPKYFYVYGTDVRNINYSTTANTFRLNFRPVAPAISTSHAGGYTAIAGIDFPYYGSGKIINYTPPIIAGNVIWDDVSKAQHPSSRLLLGAALRVNGVNGQQGNFEFFLGNMYTIKEKYDLLQSRGYVDGTIPTSGFSYTLGDPSTPVTTDVVGDSPWKKVSLLNLNWSARDIQAGVFLNITNVAREAGGVRLAWNPQTTNKYTIQYFPTLGGPTNILGTNLTGPTFLDTQALTNPARFYRLRGQ